MDDPRFYKPGFIPFSEKTWDKFKSKMMTIIPREAISSNELLQDPVAAQFVRNYAEANFLNPQKVEELKQKGISLKFANMSIDVGGPEQISFPIVNEYKGHHIYRTGYFVRVGSTITMKYIDVVPGSNIELVT